MFCLHPIASSVVYPASSGRETLLPSTWTLLATYAYLRPGRKWYGLAVFAFAGALFSKEQAVIVPALFLLADLLGLSGEPPGRSLRQWMLRYLPIAPIMLIYIGIRRLLFEGTEFTFGSLGGPFLSIAYALQDIFLPFVELHYEPTVAIWLSWPRLAISFSLLILMTVLAIRLWPSIHRVAWFWLGWFVVNLLPTATCSSKRPPSTIATSFWPRFRCLRWQHPSPQRSGVESRQLDASDLGLVLVACCAAISHHRAVYFAMTSSFSRQWLRINPGSVNAHFDMGSALVRGGEFDEAIKHYTEVLRIRPDYAAAHNNLGNAFLKSGRVKSHCLTSPRPWDSIQDTQKHTTIWQPPWPGKTSCRKQFNTSRRFCGFSQAC